MSDALTKADFAKKDASPDGWEVAAASEAMAYVYFNPKSLTIAMHKCVQRLGLYSLQLL